MKAKNKMSKTKKEARGGARKNAGREKKNNVMIYVRVPAEYAPEAKKILQELKLQLEERRYQERIARKEVKDENN